MAHAGSGTLMAYLDGEMPVRDRTAIESHIGECRPCEAELTELRSMSSTFASAMALSDVVSPMLRARARLEPHIPAAAGVGARPRRAPIPAGLLKAAAIVLLVAGAASAAIPGTPLRRLVETIAERAATLVSDAPSATIVDVPDPVLAVPPVVEQRQPGNELMVVPVGGRARVSIHSPVQGATIAVRLVDSATSVRVVALGADETRFQTGAGYIDVFENTAGLVVEVPRDLESMTVIVDGRVYFVRDGEQTRLLGPGAETRPDEFVFQAHSP